jgi:ABC-type dipeptide/oligopeptide/nickel transport system permease component
VKILTITGLVIGFLSLSIGLYHYFETNPNERAFRKTFDYKNPVSKRLWQDYKKTSDMQGIVIGITAIIALLIGIVATIKEKKWYNFLIIGISLIPLLIVLITKTHAFS